MAEEQENLIGIHVVYISAFAAAALPLYILFIRKQMVHQQLEGNSFLLPEFPEGVLHDMFESLYATFYWNFFLTYTVKRQ